MPGIYLGRTFKQNIYSLSNLTNMCTSNEAQFLQNSIDLCNNFLEILIGQILPYDCKVV